jgi:hypothetical protein
VSGFDNVRRGAIDGIVVSARYKLLDRERSPFALTLGLEPHWARTDENTGERVENYGAELSIAVDTKLLKDKVFGAFNLNYDPEVTRQQDTGAWQREATLGLSRRSRARFNQECSLGRRLATSANMMGSNSPHLQVMLSE